MNVSSKLRLCTLALLAPVLLAGCGTLRPNPLTAQENAERARQDFATLLKEHVPVSGPLTLSQAIARALRYNYDAELSRLEQTLQERQIDLAMAQMLPRLAATAGYNWRNRPNAAESINVVTRQPSLFYSYSEEPDHATASLYFSWNALDVGVGFFQARQQGYRALVAVERRRRVINNIIKGVQDAYWKAVVAQELLPQLDPLLQSAERMLGNSRQIVRQRLQPRTQALEYQQNLLEVISQLRHMRSDLNNARVQLASLIDVPLDSQFSLVPPAAESLPRPHTNETPMLEEMGLNLRPELREAAYQERIDRQDIYKEMIKMMPGIGILGSLSYDSNHLAYYNTWGEFGVRATYNLISLIEGPRAIAAARSSVEVAKARRMALGVAVLTQVNLGYQEYLSALEDLASAKELDQVQRELSNTALSAEEAQAQPEAVRVRRALQAMAADFELGRARSAAYAALANLYIATGVDLVPADVEVGDLPKLADQVNVSIQPWERGRLPEMPASAVVPPPAAGVKSGS